MAWCEDQWLRWRYRKLQASAIVAMLICATPTVADDVGVAGSGQLLAGGVGYATAIRQQHCVQPVTSSCLLLAFESPHADSVPLWRSDDEGAHWRLQQTVEDQAHPGDLRWRLRWQPNLIQAPRASGPLPKGTLLLAANATADDRQQRVAAEDLQLYASTDAGRSWSYRGSIVQGAGHPEDADNHGVWEPNLRILDDGRMVAYYSSEQHKAEGYNQLLAHRISLDGGRSWGMEHVDVAMPGGVERPGMAVVTRLPDGRYVMSYEDIDGPDNGHVYLKFSRDGLDFGDSAERGIPVRSMSGGWPAASPIVQWLPLGENPQRGILAVLAERAGGGADEGGRSLWWNADDGRGPWWQMPAPVQKQTGNIHAGWTQALLVLKDHRLLHITSSSVAAASADASRNQMRYASRRLSFDRYEGEDAARRQAVQIGDASASAGGKVRLAAAPFGALDFDVRLQHAGDRRVALRWRALSFPTQPVLSIDGHVITLSDHADSDDWRIASADITLGTAGAHRVEIVGGTHALDVDYLELVPTALH